MINILVNISHLWDAVLSCINWVSRLIIFNKVFYINNKLTANI